MVNGGPVKICEIFLGQPNKDMTPAKRKQLAVIMIDFLNLCQTRARRQQGHHHHSARQVPADVREVF
jgi:hypothetical protein